MSELDGCLLAAERCAVHEDALAVTDFSLH